MLVLACCLTFFFSSMQEQHNIVLLGPAKLTSPPVAKYLAQTYLKTVSSCKSLCPEHVDKMGDWKNLQAYCSRISPAVYMVPWVRETNFTFPIPAKFQTIWIPLNHAPLLWGVRGGLCWNQTKTCLTFIDLARCYEGNVQVFAGPHFRASSHSPVFTRFYYFQRLSMYNTCLLLSID